MKIDFKKFLNLNNLKQVSSKIKGKLFIIKLDLIIFL